MGSNAEYQVGQLLKQVAAIEARLKALETEHERLRKASALADVRSKCLYFTYETPIQYRGRGRGSCAYSSGYEAGFRGWKDQNPYDATNHFLAFEHGFRVGRTDAQKEADAALILLSGTMAGCHKPAPQQAATPAHRPEAVVIDGSEDSDCIVIGQTDDGPVGYCDPRHPSVVMSRAIYGKMVADAKAKGAEIARLKKELDQAKAKTDETCSNFVITGGSVEANCGGKP